MNITELEATVRAMTARGKGLLAADESSGTIKKRFDSIGLESTETNRRDYRQMLFTTDGIEQAISQYNWLLADLEVRYIAWKSP